uniref:PDZ domain-containing protein n=1 Tax=Eptatretus burgeri TaxID=7764 RepID=A0A8C4Q7T1_EPTBU
MQQAARNGHVNLTVRRPAEFPDATEQVDLLHELTREPVNGQTSVEDDSSPPRLSGWPIKNPWSSFSTPAPIASAACSISPQDILICRRDDEGFGFVIISSIACPEPGNGPVIPHKIGRIVPGSPAERGGVLRVGHRILAVNGRSITMVPHEQVVSMVKEAGVSVTLTVLPIADSNNVPSPHPAHVAPVMAFPLPLGSAHSRYSSRTGHSFLTSATRQ